MKVKSKVWLEKDGFSILGDGRRELLRAIERHGSISEAGREMDMPYRRCWSYIKAMEQRLGVSLVERWTGGKDGGGARLTGEAVEFLKKFEELEQGITEAVDERFDRIFARND